MKALLWKSSVFTYVDDLTWLINFSRTKRCFYFWQLLCSERSTARPTAVTAWPQNGPPWTNLFPTCQEVCKGALQPLLPRTSHRGRVACQSPSSRIRFLNTQPLAPKYERKKKKQTLEALFCVKIFWKYQQRPWNQPHEAWHCLRGCNQVMLVFHGKSATEKKNKFLKMNLFTIIWVSVPESFLRNWSKEIVPPPLSSEVHWSPSSIFSPD